MGGFGNIARTIGGVGNDVSTAQIANKQLDQQAIADRLANLKNQLSVDPSLRFAMIEKALGRPLTPQEKQTILGLQPIASPVAKYSDVKTDANGRQYGVSSITGRYEIIPGQEDITPTSTKPRFTSLQEMAADALQRGDTDTLKKVNTEIASARPDKPDTSSEEDQRYERIQTAVAMKRPVSQEDAAWASAYVKRKTLGQTTTFNLTSSGISDDAVDMAATIYRITNKMPPLGMGSPALREKILNRAAAQAKEIASGNTTKTPGEAAGSDIAASAASYTAGASALTQLQRTRSAVGAFERTALKNLDLFTNAAKKVVDSGSPWVNQPLRAVSRGGLGSADLAAFDTARQVALTEVARVVNNPNLTGILTDEGRKSIEQAAGPNATLAQIYSAVNILKRDMENRRNSLDEEISGLTKQLRGGAGGSTPASAKDDPLGIR